jgi:uncharacterized protein YdaU (DUF1376 family)
MSRPWMPLYVGDYLVDTLDLRAEESGVYLLMLMIAWRRPDGALPNDMKWLQRALASCVNDMHGNRFNRLVPPLLERFFVLGEDGKFRNKRLTKERERAENFSEKQRENAEKRWSEKNKIKHLADADAMPARALQSQSQSHNKDPEADASGAEAPPDPPVDHRKRLFGEGLATLARISGKGPDACRSFVGKCLKAASDDAVTVLGLIEDAERNQTVNPTAWIVSRLQPTGNPNGRRTVHDAARDLHENLLERIAAFDEPAPSGLRDGTGPDVVRLLPPRRRE